MLGGPVYPSMKDVWDPWFLEGPGSLSRSNGDRRQFAATVSEGFTGFAALPPGDVQGFGARPWLRRPGGSWLKGYVLFLPRVRIRETRDLKAALGLERSGHRSGLS